MIASVFRTFRVGVLFCVLVLPFGCFYSWDKEADVEEWDGRITSGYILCEAIPLGKTRFRANISACYYTDEENRDYDYVEIEVTRKNHSGYAVWFCRKVSLDEVPLKHHESEAFGMYVNPKEIVQYDVDTETVHFKLKTTSYSYTLPKRVREPFITSE
jgi:hypothetical protein